jgi:hypothetical protein
MYYALVEKATGKFHNGANKLTDPDYPRADTLDVVPLNLELTTVLTVGGSPTDSSAKPINWLETKYNFETNEWDMVYDQVIQFDPVVELEKQRTKFLAEAYRLLSISDLSTSARSKVQAYIDDLEAMIINNETKADASDKIREFTL